MIKEVMGMNKFGWFSTSGVQRLREERKAMTSESYQGLHTVDPPVGAFVGET
jgi:hypothetical protein